MKISVGTILFNAESCLPKNMLNAWLAQAYDIADQILITEGATRAKNHYFDGDASSMTEDGKSTDETIEIIRSFPDPERKILLFQSNDFWDGKTTMCNAWNDHVTGDYLWFISSDEFYLEEDIGKILKLLEDEEPDQVDFFADHFWGDFNHCVDERMDGSWGNDIPWERIFKHIPGSKWERHEPPRYLHPDGALTIDKKLMDKYKTLAMGIKLKHYAYVCEQQVDFKTKFYKDQSCRRLWDEWQKDHEVRIVQGSKTFKYSSAHPESIRNYVIPLIHDEKKSNSSG